MSWAGFKTCFIHHPRPSSALLLMASTSSFGKKKKGRWFYFRFCWTYDIKKNPNFLFQVKRNTTWSLSEYEIELFRNNVIILGVLFFQPPCTTPICIRFTTNLCHTQTGTTSIQTSKNINQVTETVSTVFKHRYRFSFSQAFAKK